MIERTMTWTGTIHAENVNDAWRQGVDLMLRDGKCSASRAGPVLATPYPVQTIYRYPCQRVLFDPVRDANPFFHLMEALWMLSGSNDGKFLDRYVNDFSARFAEPNSHGNYAEIHGAYGYRWRKHFGFDQLEEIIKRLSTNSNDRQAVLSMWDATRKIGNTLGGQYSVGAKDLTDEWKDRPCNTQAYFRIVDGQLDMCVTCRSNDIMWGAYGANAVHFSFLQEYVAGMVGVPVGFMYQYSWNWHAYEATFKPYVEASEDNNFDRRSWERIYSADVPVLNPIMTNPKAWDTDLRTFMTMSQTTTTVYAYANPWFRTVAVPLVLAHDAVRRKQYDVAIAQLNHCTAEDWRVACFEWINRRVDRAKEREAAGVVTGRFSGTNPTHEPVSPARPEPVE